MSASIRFDHLFTYAVEEPQVRLPISFLSDGSGHIHGELAIHHIGGGNPLPSLGYFGPDDVCLNTWTQELHAIEEALSKAASLRAPIAAHESSFRPEIVTRIEELGKRLGV